MEEEEEEMDGYGYEWEMKTERGGRCVAVLI